MSIKIDLSKKNVLITGAGGGIGSIITKKFLEAGANCICVDKNFKKSQVKFIKKNFNQKVQFLKLDFEKNFLKNLKKNLKKKFTIDVLVNNAGFTSSEHFLNYRLNNWEKTLRINLTATFIISQEIAKNFMTKEGSIINITSLSAEQGFPKNVAYVASKGGLKQLTKAMAIDLAYKKIRVNSVGPGYVKSNMTKKNWSNLKKREYRKSRMISDDLANPEDIANTCVFLSSKLAKYINGQDIYVDGGWLAKGLHE